MAGVLAQALRTLNRLCGVGDDAVAPTTHLVAEQSKTTGCAAADRALGDHAALAGHAPCRPLLDHEPSLWHVHLKR